jgi:hypothetical protein
MCAVLSSAGERIPTLLANSGTTFRRISPDRTRQGGAEGASDKRCFQRSSLRGLGDFRWPGRCRDRAWYALLCCICTNMTRMKHTEKFVMDKDVSAEINRSCLLTRIHRISRVVTNIFDQELRPLDINSHQFSLLVVILRIGRASRAEIGALITGPINFDAKHSDRTFRRLG